MQEGRDDTRTRCARLWNCRLDDLRGGLDEIAIPAPTRRIHVRGSRLLNCLRPVIDSWRAILHGDGEIARSSELAVLLIDCA